jgi:hypothetical protein
MYSRVYDTLTLIKARVTKTNMAEPVLAETPRDTGNNRTRHESTPRALHLVATEVEDVDNVKEIDPMTHPVRITANALTAER